MEAGIPLAATKWQRRFSERLRTEVRHSFPSPAETRLPWSGDGRLTGVWATPKSRKDAATSGPGAARNAARIAGSVEKRRLLTRLGTKARSSANRLVKSTISQTISTAVSALASVISEVISSTYGLETIPGWISRIADVYMYTTIAKRSVARGQPGAKPAVGRLSAASAPARSTARGCR